MNWLKEIREKLNVSQAQLAHLINVQRTALAQDEIDYRSIGANAKLRLAPILIALSNLDKSIEKPDRFKKWQATQGQSMSKGLDHHYENCRTSWHKNQLKLNKMRMEEKRSMRALEHLYGILQYADKLTTAQKTWINFQIDTETQNIQLCGKLQQQILEIKIAGIAAEIEQHKKMRDADFDIIHESVKLLTKSAKGRSRK
jgi:transcriptional regulator with XRE-family HTH domain